MWGARIAGSTIVTTARCIAREVDRIRRYREQNRRSIVGYLREHPCVDCGESDALLLEFDHVDPAAKSHNVTVLATHKPWNRVVSEIAKCAMRCVACHRRRTAEQFQLAQCRPPDGGAVIARGTRKPAGQ